MLGDEKAPRRVDFLEVYGIPPHVENPYLFPPWAFVTVSPGALESVGAASARRRSASRNSLSAEEATRASLEAEKERMLKLFHDEMSACVRSIAALRIGAHLAWADGNDPFGAAAGIRLQTILVEPHPRTFALLGAMARASSPLTI